MDRRHRCSVILLAEMLKQSLELQSLGIILTCNIKSSQMKWVSSVRLIQAAFT